METGLQFKFALILFYLFLSQCLQSQSTCTTDFNLRCPARYQGCVDESPSSMNTGFPTVTHSAPLCDSIQYTYVDQPLSINSCNNNFNRVWTATMQGANLARKCSQRIELFDNTPPDISSCPQNDTLDTPNTAFNWLDPQVSDNCGTASLTSNFSSGHIFPIGTSEILYTATDGCGNTSTCSFFVTVQDTCETDFSIICPSNFVDCRDASSDPFNTGNANVTHSGDFCGSLSIDYTDSEIMNTACEYAFDRLWSATSSQTNETKTCTQRITLSDSQSPIINNCPSDVTLEFEDRVYTWAVPTATDDCVTPVLEASVFNGSSFSVGTTTVVYTATDDCGNTSSCSFSVTVKEECDTNFSLSCPSNFIGCRSASTDPFDTGNANVTHSGDFCGSVSIDYNDQVITNADCSYIVDRVWTATASETNESKSCTQRLTLEDISAPVINNCPTNITLDYDDRTYTWANPTVSDNCGTPTLQSSVTNGTTFPIGSTTVTLSATDECGNVSNCSFIVIVEDDCSTDFSINCPSNFSGCRSLSTDPQNTGQATVTHSGDFCGTVSIEYNDEIVTNTSCSYIVNRVWKATSSETNQSKTCTQRLTLEDSENPVINTCPSSVTLDYDQRIYTWSVPTAADNCGSPSLQSSIANGSTFPIGTTTVTYTATDQCGNASTCSFNVTVEQQCNTDFSINCPTNYNGCYDDTIDPSSTGNATITHSGNFCGTISIDYIDELVSQSGCSKIINRVWKATSSKSLQTKTCNQKLTLQDNTPPSISECPSDITLEFNDRTYSWNNPLVSDNCGTVTLQSSTPSGSTFDVGVTEVVITATDNCGNSSRCSFKVTVKTDNTGSGLVVDCPADIIIDCGENLNMNNWPQLTVSSTCGNCDSDYSSNFVDMGHHDGHRYYCSKYQATWQEAADKARQMGGYLVIINDEYENRMLANFLEVRSAFIGLSDHQNEGHFKWVDGTGVSYSNWYPGQPNNYRNSQDYVELLNNGYWNDQYNYKKLEFIVEIPCIRVEQIEGPSSPSAFTGSSAVIKYKITDGCGNVEFCDFKVEKTGGLSVHCPDNISVNLTGSSTTVVSWEDPSFETCCNSGASDVINIPGYVYMGSKDGHRYYCSEAHLTWQDAQRECQRYGGYLAVINDQSENKMLADFLTVQSAFIGLSDHEQEGHFRWVNGDPLNYTNWYADQPNNYANDQHYVELLHNGQWNDQYYYKKREYIMEIPGGVEVTQISGPQKGSSLSAGEYNVRYHAQDQCGNNAFCSFDIFVNGSSGNICSTGPTNSSSLWIESVKFGSYSNSSGNNNGYENFTSNCIAVTKGDVVDIDLTAGTRSHGAVQYWGLFVDWNEDNDFTKNERIATGRSKYALRGRFIFSPSLPSGSFKMRIISSLSGYPDNGCDPVIKGEVEDYCLNVNATGHIQKEVHDIAKVRMNKEVSLEAYDLISEELNSRPEIALKEAQLEIIPNPFTSLVRINGDEIQKIRIWTSSGVMLKEIEFENARNQIELSLTGLPKGMLLLESVHSNGVFSIEKIIKE